MNFHIEYCEEFRTARTLLTEQDNQDSTVRTGQPEQDRQERRARSGQPEEDQAGQDSQGRTAYARTGMPGQE
jgi:hypothetical protein